MDEMTFEEFCDLPTMYCGGYQADWGAQRMYRNERIGLQVEVVTKRVRRGDPYSGWREGKVFYYLDADRNRGLQHCYNTIDQAYVSYMEYACGLKGEGK